MKKNAPGKKKSSGNSIYDIYFSVTQEYFQKYGNHIILFYQVGAFFEMYGIQLKDATIHGSKVEEFTQLAQLNMSVKDFEYSYDGKEASIVMAGFRDYSLDKYLKTAVQNQYTAIVYVQNTSNPTQITRELYGVFSPGTFISYDTDSSQQLTNHIVCIWISTYMPFQAKSGTQEKIVCGIANAHVFNGQSSIFEYETTFVMNPTTFDELERYISVLAPSEAIIISSLSAHQTNQILQYVGLLKLGLGSIHKIVLGEETDANKLKLVESCQTQTYISHMLSTFFGNETFQICSEFHNHMISTQAYCYLLHFLQEHNKDLVRRLKMPVCNNIDGRMILANHTLKQLNIIDDDNEDGKQSGKLSSVLNFLNRCCSPMGKRLFKTQMTTPTYDEEWLQTEYDMIELFMGICVLGSPSNTGASLQIVRKYLSKIRDLEKVVRQIVLKKIYPNSIYFLYDSLLSIQQLVGVLNGYSELMKYLSCGNSNGNDEHIDISTMVDDLLKHMDSVLHMDKCRGVESLSTFTENIIREGVSPRLDKIMKSHDENQQIITSVRQVFNNMMKVNEDDTTEYIKLHETEKSGASLQITKKRGEQLKGLLHQFSSNIRPKGEKMNELEQLPCSSSMNKGEGEGSKVSQITFLPTFVIPMKDIRFIKSSSSNDEIEFPQLTHVFKQGLLLKDEWMSEVSKSFLTFLVEFEKNWLDKLDAVIQWVTLLDVLQCKTYVATEYNYCKPMLSGFSASPMKPEEESQYCLTDTPSEFIDEADKSEFQATGLRHVLIEHIQQNELYVSNDLCLSSDESEHNGILIFGTNAVGKTSFIRAIGIAIIMAQCGMYVPCSSFVYKPYHSIFSRILGNDNIFKGLSTFAVEMSELRIILKMADRNSLVLGDELCSGTEMESALSLFSAGLVELHQKECTFLFATHFHEITKYDEIKGLKQMGLKHMSVSYDAANKVLVYDRILKDGQGNKMYGLEVCKSLYMDTEFLEKAFEFRNKYFPEERGELSYGKSKYNAKKIRGKCEICKEEMGEEVHHLIPQSDADKNGFVAGTANMNVGSKGTFHKNHVANLANVCSKCHDKLHQNGVKAVRKKTTGGYTIM